MRQSGNAAAIIAALPGAVSHCQRDPDAQSIEPAVERPRAREDEEYACRSTDPSKSPRGPPVPPS